MKRIDEVGQVNIDKLAPEVVPGIRVLPVVHARVDMASIVRVVLDKMRPAGVAVELPTTLEESVGKAILRLPKISLVIAYEPDDEAIVWVVAPGDPFSEALRWVKDRKLRSFCIDPDLRYVERHNDPVPDPHLIWEKGPADYLGLLRDLGDASSTPTDIAREMGMAFHAQ